MEGDHPSEENDIVQQESIPQDAENQENEAAIDAGQETVALDQENTLPAESTESSEQQHLEPNSVPDTTRTIVPEVSIIAEPFEPVPEQTHHRSSIVEPTRLSIVESRRSEVRNSRVEEVDRLEAELYAKHRAKRSSVLDPDLIDFPDQVLQEVEKITNQKQKTVRDIDPQNFKL
jgi:hypothetical protein